jgi:hypothetical protein
VMVAVTALVVLAGFIGTQDPFTNIITTFVWVIWWVGFAFLSALVFDLWSVVNPFRTLFAWSEHGYAAATGKVLSRHLRYPPRLGHWPAVALFLLFAWGELIWAGNDVPRHLAWAISGYALLTWLGMFVWGRETWLHNGEAFAIAFGVLGRFAPLTTDAGSRLRARLPGAGLMVAEGVSISFVVFVLAMLSTVTFDGFLETPLFHAITDAIYSSPATANLLFQAARVGISDLQIVMTVGLLLFPALFVLAYWITSWAMVRATARLAPGAPSADPRAQVAAVASAFVLTLVPIAVAYHLSHYFSLLFTAGPLIIPLLSDPFGWGWNLFGTRDYDASLVVVSPYLLWYGATALIVLGHVVAVYLAHEVALRTFGTRRAAWVSQVPMVVLMVFYTMTSLWILAQPVVG